jgi:hypothetical protein
MTVNDYKVIDMPALLGRSVVIQDPTNKDKWVRDNSWYKQVRAIYACLYDFLLSNKLITETIEDNSLDNLTVRLSSFTKTGQILVKSEAIDKWISSFDRPNSKKNYCDIKYLQNALTEIYRTHN